MTAPQLPPHLTTISSSHSRNASWGWGFFGAVLAYSASICAILGVYPFFSGVLAATSVSCFLKIIKKEDMRSLLSIFVGPPRS